MSSLAVKTQQRHELALGIHRVLRSSRHCSQSEITWRYADVYMNPGVTQMIVP